MNRFQNHLRVLLTLSLIALTLPAWAADKYALLIGVTKYEHSGMSALKYPEDDARALGELLDSGGYEVELLLGQDATQRAIREKLEALRKKGTAEGVIVLGLFGHGIEVETQDGTEVVKDGCFCPFDTDIRFAKDFKGRELYGKDKQKLTEPDPATLVKLSEVMSTFQLAKAGHRVLLADCCRVVPNQARGRSFGSGFKASHLPENTSVLFGCSPNEQAFEHEDWGHGAFTKSLLEQLPLMASQGEVTTGTLADRVKKQVPLLVKAVSPRDSQTPKLFNTDSIDLQLVLKRELPQVTGTKAGETREVTLPGGVQQKYVWCPAGSFTMGTPGATDDESPVEVTLSSGFWLAQTETTQAQYTAIMGTTPWVEHGDTDYYKAGATFPASYIDHAEAEAYCVKLTEIERKAGRLPTGWKYALPTEAQWEYACRAGETTAYSFGDNDTRLVDFAWFDKNAWDNGDKFAHTVATKKSNPWELHDMHGNVWEWCRDAYERKLAGGRDPFADSTDPAALRVFRSGSWNSASNLCRSALRYWYLPPDRHFNLGFRPATVPVE